MIPPLYFRPVPKSSRTAGRELHGHEKAGEVLLSACANPDCGNPFDYRQGRLFRIQQGQPEDGAARKVFAVRHFWLCSQCAETYTVECSGGSGGSMTPRLKRRVARPSRFAHARALRPQI